MEIINDFIFSVYIQLNFTLKTVILFRPCFYFIWTRWGHETRSRELLANQFDGFMCVSVVMAAESSLDDSRLTACEWESRTIKRGETNKVQLNTSVCSKQGFTLIETGLFMETQRHACMIYIRNWMLVFIALFICVDYILLHFHY